MSRLTVFIILICLLWFAGCNTKNSSKVFDLKCENLHNPTAIDKTIPRFSWKIKSSQNGTEQKAFQIIVASDVSLLKEGKADFWDSGKVEFSTSILVPYKGKNRQFRNCCSLESACLG